MQAIRQGDWKLRITTEDSIQLFNLNVDPSEMYNRAVEFPERINKLTEMMRKFAYDSKSEFEVD